MVQFALSADGAAVRQHDVFCDRQPQSGAAGFAGAGFVDSIEAFKQPRQMFGRNTRTEILDIEFNRLAMGRAPRTMPASGSGIFQRIIHQV